MKTPGLVPAKKSASKHVLYGITLEADIQMIFEVGSRPRNLESTPIPAAEVPTIICVFIINIITLNLHLLKLKQTHNTAYFQPKFNFIDKLSLN